MPALDDIYHSLLDDLTQSEVALTKAEEKLEAIKILLPNDEDAIRLHIRDVERARERYQRARYKHRRCVEMLFGSGQSESADERERTRVLPFSAA